MPPSMAIRHLCLACMTHCVTKAMPIHFIDSKCHIKQLNAGKSCKVCLNNHTWSISHHIMLLVINALGGGHTHICQHANKHDFKKPGEQHAPGLKSEEIISIYAIYIVLLSSKLVINLVTNVRNISGLDEAIQVMYIH